MAMQTLILSHPLCSSFIWPACPAPPRNQWVWIRCAHSRQHRQLAVLMPGFLQWQIAASCRSGLSQHSTTVLPIVIRIRMIQSETWTISDTSNPFSVRRTQTLPVPVTFPDRNRKSFLNIICFKPSISL